MNISDWWSTYRVSVRALFKRPAFAILVIATLGTGIGACVAVFAVVDSVLLRPLPFDAPEKLALLQSLNADSTGKIEPYGVSVSDFIDWRYRSRTFQDLGAMQPTDFGMIGVGEPEQVDGGLISANLFSVLGVKPQHGRFFTPEEEVENSPFAILSYEFWQRRFGGASSILGRTIVVDGIGRQVVGIAPPGIFFSANADVWLPLNLKIPADKRIPSRNTAVAGRLRERSTIQQASAEIASIAEQLAREFPTNKGWSAHAVPIREPYVRDVRRILFLIFGAVSFLLLVSSINVANLVLVRILERSSEFRLRMALGGTRKQILIPGLMENMTLSILAGITGLLLSTLLIKPLIALSPIVGTSPAGNRILNSVAFDDRVFLFVVLLSILTGLALSVLPLLQISRAGSFEASGKRMTGSVKERGFQKAFVVIQLALSFLLLIGAIWMTQTFLELKKVDPGFRVDHMLTARIALPASNYQTHEPRFHFQKQLIESVSTIPGVRSVSSTSRLPLNEFAMTTLFEVDGIVGPDGGFVANFRRVGPSYIHTIGARLLKGREFTPDDVDTGMPVAFVSKEMEKRLWKGESAIGKRIRRTAATDRAWRTVVGVVDDVKDTSLTAPTGMTLYTPVYQQTIPAFHLVVRTAVPPADAVKAIRETVKQIDPRIPLYQVTTAEELFFDSLSRPRFAAYTLAAFAVLGFLISILGVYGVVSYTSAKRTNEIGVRMAIGAKRPSILLMILKESALLSICGIAFGILLAVLFRQFATPAEFQSTGVPAFVQAAFVIIFAALAASLIPAFRATRVDPVIALRYE